MQITKVALAILIIFGVITLIQLVYYYVIYGRFAFHRKKAALGFRDIPVSVVIVVRDDAAQVLQTLPSLLEQQYSFFEIVIVNDRSRDEYSLQAIKEYKERYPNIKIVDLSTAVSTSRGKKMAISMGIKCATYEHILLTSPNSIPASKQWLSMMAQNFQFQKKIVLGYSTFTKKRGPYSHFLHFDNLVGAMQYFSHALFRSTYRGDLNNLAFVRPLFYQQKGFISYNHLLYGEEDIFVYRAANQNNTAIEFAPEATMVRQHVPEYRYWRLHKITLLHPKIQLLQKQMFAGTLRTHQPAFLRNVGLRHRLLPAPAPRPLHHPRHRVGAHHQHVCGHGHLGKKAAGDANYSANFILRHTICPA